MRCLKQPSSEKQSVKRGCWELGGGETDSCYLVGMKSPLGRMDEFQRLLCSTVPVVNNSVCALKHLREWVSC